MPIFDRGSVVRVPFPYVDKNTREHRPALVISAGGTGEGQALLWVLMITSAQNRPWPGDVAIEESPTITGLRVPSVIRTAKIATIEARSTSRLGSIGRGALAKVDRELSKTLGR